MLPRLMGSDSGGLTWSLIEEARGRIAGKVHVTPVLRSAALDALAGAELHFKCENLQKCGAFKARGATNAVFALSESEARHGVGTHSSGNHGAALAYAAGLRGISAHVVMPRNAAASKRAAVARYGAEITWCDPTLAARESTLREVVAATGARVVHPYDDLAVMAGQATVAAELLEQVPDLDLILCPVGGGGLLSGIAFAARTLQGDIRVIGVEPAGADDAARSFRSGHIVPSIDPRTIADGLRSSLGERPFAEIRRFVSDIVTVPEEAIVTAMRRLWEVLKIVVEPSGAVPFAALLAPETRQPLLAAIGTVRSPRIGIVLSGGNVDLERLPWSAASDSFQHHRDSLAHTDAHGAEGVAAAARDELPGCGGRKPRA